MPLSIESEKRRDRNSERGIALILVAVATVIIGVFMALGLGVFNVPDQPDFEQTTRHRMDRLVHQLSSFAQIYGRVPCPAAPNVNAGTAAFGTEARAGGPGTACGIVEGVVPFRALGLDNRDGMDGWGRYFTYRVSPVFTNLDGIPDKNIQIFDECRLELMWVDNIERINPDPTTSSGGTGTENPLPLVNRNLNPAKAKFCCPGLPVSGFAAPNTDIIMVDATGTPIPTQVRPNNPATVADDETYTVRSSAAGVPGPNANGPVGAIGNLYGDINTPFTLPGSYSGNATAFVFVLVSHGENGLGAFQANGTNNRFPGAANGELLNADGTTTGVTPNDLTFTSRSRILVPGANYYDDIVEFRTQDTLYAELGRRSCKKPYL